MQIVYTAPSHHISLTIHIHNPGCTQKLIKSAISSRYGPHDVLPNLRAIFPSAPSVIMLMRKRISAIAHDPPRIASMQARSPVSIPMAVTILARFFLMIFFILFTHKVIPSVVERAREKCCEPYENSEYDGHSIF